MTPDRQLFEKAKRKGECWHRYIEGGGNICVCGYSTGNPAKGLAFHIDNSSNPDFTTPEGFFWLWERMSESQDWLHFWMFLYEKVRTNYQNQDDSSFWRIHLVGLVNSGKCLINPLKFRAALMEYWGIKEEL